MPRGSQFSVKLAGHVELLLLGTRFLDPCFILMSAIIDS